MALGGKTVTAIVRGIVLWLFAVVVIVGIGSEQSSLARLGLGPALLFQGLTPEAAGAAWSALRREAPDAHMYGRYDSTTDSVEVIHLARTHLTNIGVAG